MTTAAGAVVVTGAARGIGAAIARRFAEDGYTVIGVDRDGEPLNEVMGALPGGRRSSATSPTRTLIEEACERGAAHGLRAFVANAGDRPARPVG